MLQFLWEENMKYLIFFDINGTIIKRDSRTDLPFEYAVNKLLDVDNSLNNIDTSARSDKDVFMEILQNFNKTYSEDLWEQFLDCYIEQLETFTKTDVWRENVDAVEFIKWLTNTEHELALITGELSIGAEYKLNKIGVWQYFDFGGFGEDGLKRFDIATSALNKANHLNYDEIIIIGDTVLDIQTARHIGAKVISITTGSHTREQLISENPDYIIDEFKEIKHLF